MICDDCKIRARAKGRRICNNCKNKRYEQKHPIRVAFHRLKSHAKQRNKEFTLTYNQFEKFCIKVEYIAKKGRSQSSYHIDRIDESKGYHIDNIQVLTNAENVKKYKRWTSLDEEGRSVFKTIINKPPDESMYDDCPF